MESPALRKKSFTRVAALMGAVIRAGSCWRMVRSGTRLLNTPVPHSTTANAATAATRVYRLKNTRTALRRTRARTVGVKGIVCERAFELAREHGFYFVGAHPMAGTQFSGYAHSRADLFQGAPLVLVPPAVDDALKLELLGQVREMVRPLGFGKFSVTSADEHDRVIAFTSQLAHVVSNAYVKSPTAQVHHGFSAGSYRDLTRVAHLNPQMWSELMIDDADALAFEIDHLIESLGAYSRALKDRDQRYLENLLAEGDRIKRALDDEASH